MNPTFSRPPLAVQLTSKVTADQAEIVRAVAADLQIDAAELIRRALDHYLATDTAAARAYKRATK